MQKPVALNVDLFHASLTECHDQAFHTYNLNGDFCKNQIGYENRLGLDRYLVKMFGR